MNVHIRPMRKSEGSDTAPKKGKVLLDERAVLSGITQYPKATQI